MSLTDSSLLMTYRWSYLIDVLYLLFIFFFFNDTATTEIYTLSLHDALPICRGRGDLHHPVAEAEGVRFIRRGSSRLVLALRRLSLDVHFPVGLSDVRKDLGTGAIWIPLK